ncbi:MAG: aminoacyl-tRNA hydrolase, partial [Victivallales bacterium]|nr:aminoacyl-tRNA hydrolase [Victivallales bacterium]
MAIQSDNTDTGAVGGIAITDTLSIAEDELSFVCCRSSGPGGQHVNRTDSAVQLRFSVADSPALPEDIRRRLLTRAKRFVTSEGTLLLECDTHRSQQRNREECVRRFVELVRAASRPPKVRRPTKPTAASRERRLQSKKRHSEIKSARGGSWE